MAKKKSQTYELFGTFRWSKVFPDNRVFDGPEGTDYEAFDGLYITDFIFEEDALEKFEATGSQWKVYGNEPTEKKRAESREKHGLEEGQFMIRPRREHAPQHGIAALSGPPTVVLGDGTPIDPAEGMGVGNGSEGYVNFTVYQTGVGNGSRLNGIQVTDWKKYPLATGKASFQTRAVRVHEYTGEDEETPAAKPKATKAKASKAEEELADDEIPL